MSCCLPSCCIAIPSYRIVWYRVVSHHTVCHRIVPCGVVWHLAISYRLTYRIVSCVNVSYHTVSHRIETYQIESCHTVIVSKLIRSNPIIALSHRNLSHRILSYQYRIESRRCVCCSHQNRSFCQSASCTPSVRAAISSYCREAQAHTQCNIAARKNSPQILMRWLTGNVFFLADSPPNNSPL